MIPDGSPTHSLSARMIHALGVMLPIRRRRPSKSFFRSVRTCQRKRCRASSRESAHRVAATWQRREGRRRSRLINLAILFGD